MKTRSIYALVLAALLLSLSSLQVAAHSSVAAVMPPNGAVLAHSPATIEIRFHGAVSLTSVVLVQAGKPDRTLEFTPNGSASTFQLPDPQLGPGRNEIRWKALSHDGHVVSGSLVFQIKPEAKAS
jgi:methionine-rich copper-binding protein CopC